MTEETKIGFAERLRQHVGRGPVPASRAASVLTQMLFGMVALAAVCFDGWCLGWLSMNAAANAVVTAGLLVAAFYGMSLERYYRGLQMPRLSSGARRTCVVAWVGLGILTAMTIKHCGFIVSTMSLLAMLYLFFAFLGCLISRGRPQELRLLAISTLLGLSGWFVIYNCLICSILRYFEGAFGATYAETLMPQWFVQVLAFLDRRFGVTALLIEGALLILADWWLRLKVFSLRSGESVRSFFNWQVALAVLCVLLVPVCHGVTIGVLDKRADQALENYRTRFETSADNSIDDVACKEFISWQEQFGRQLVEATSSDLVVATRSPFPWRKETAGRWMPAVESADERALLESYLAQMNEVLQQLPERLGNLPVGAISSNGLLMILAWRQEAAVQLRDAAMAGECLKWTSQTVCAQLGASSTQAVAWALGNVARVVQLSERLLECFGDSEEVLDLVQSQLRELLAALQAPGALVFRQAMSQYLDWQEFSINSSEGRWGTPFGKLAWIFPPPRMLVLAETAALATAFAKADSFLTLEYPERMYDGPLVRTLLQPLIGSHYSLRSLDLLAQSQIQALLLLTAVARYRMRHSGELPPTLAALAPDCLEALPTDPMAAGQPYRLTQEEMPVAAWNFRTGAVETVTRSALVVRSTASADALATVLVQYP